MEKQKLQGEETPVVLPARDASFLQGENPPVVEILKSTIRLIVRKQYQKEKHNLYCA